MNETKITILGILTTIVVILLLICNPVAMVGVGERGVKVTLGKVSPKSYTEGIHVVTPFISKIHTMNVKTQKMHPATTVFTKDIQQARIEYVVNYNLQPDNVHKVYREVGKNYQDIIILPTVEGTLKNVIGTWNASDLISNRTKATNDILLQLQENLKDNYINVTDFQIVDIDYSDAFEKAVELKVTAEQEAQKAKNVTVRIQEEAKQKILTAEAEAKAIQLKAQALANNRQLVELEYAKKWDGNLPQNMYGGAIPFVSVAK